MELHELPLASRRNRRLKKLRGLFRKVNKICRAHKNYPERLPGDWCNHAHIHLDWKGYGDYSLAARKVFLAKYALMFRKIIPTFATWGENFQLWLMVFPHDSGSDALFFHTENPHTAFPMVLHNYTWKQPKKHLFSDFLPDFTIMEGCSSNDHCQAYYAQGVGQPLREP